MLNHRPKKTELYPDENFWSGSPALASSYPVRRFLSNKTLKLSYFHHYVTDFERTYAAFEGVESLSSAAERALKSRRCNVRGPWESQSGRHRFGERMLTATVSCRFTRHVIYRAFWWKCVVPHCIRYFCSLAGRSKLCTELIGDLGDYSDVSPDA